MKIKFEIGISIPPKTASSNNATRLALEKMKPNQSFVVDDNNQRARFLQMAKRLGYALTTRKITGMGYRIWRLK